MAGRTHTMRRVRRGVLCGLVSAALLVGTTWASAPASAAPEACDPTSQEENGSGPVVCISSSVAPTEGWGNVHFLINGQDPDDHHLVPPTVAPGDTFELTELTCGDADVPPVEIKLLSYSDFDLVATGTADYSAGTGTITTLADLGPGEYRLLVSCAPRDDGIIRGYAARVFVASGPFVFVRDTEKHPGESFWVQEATCGVNGAPPAQLDLIDTADQEPVVHIEELDLTEFITTVTVPLTASPGAYDLTLTCGPAGTPSWTVPMSVVLQAAPPAPPTPAEPPQPVAATPQFTG